ncbi:MAG: glycyl-radical enzyme activating protein [Clostridiales Family XIII bacterium]|jgi:pyruvate formate lyase activating enzyme|nr:glycyl-radical enzyme activating protein [Clostridiales Family XIII bacterium]
MAGIIVNIQRFSVHDGPGIRTEIFFKGCPLRCIWCDNPESIDPRPQLGVYPARCVGRDRCGICERACPLDECPLDYAGGRVSGARRGLCEPGCLACAEACPASALTRWGRDMRVDELLEAVLPDRGFYMKSGGGVTLSGGEVMLQWEFAAELLAACKDSRIHTCVESALCCGWEAARSVFAHADMVISDIKHMDSGRHREITGAGNEPILENLIRTVEAGKPLVLRIPVVAGYNNSEENIRATGAFVRDRLRNSILQLQLLPYRRLGVEKYESLGQAYPMEGFKAPERAAWEEDLLRLAGVLREYGVPAVAGSNVKIRR